MLHAMRKFTSNLHLRKTTHDNKNLFFDSANQKFIFMRIEIGNYSYYKMIV